MGGILPFSRGAIGVLYSPSKITIVFIQERTTTTTTTTTTLIYKNIICFFSSFFSLITRKVRMGRERESRRVFIAQIRERQCFFSEKHLCFSAPFCPGRNSFLAYIFFGHSRNLRGISAYPRRQAHTLPTTYATCGVCQGNIPVTIENLVLEPASSVCTKLMNMSLLIGQHWHAHVWRYMGELRIWIRFPFYHSVKYAALVGKNHGQHFTCVVKDMNNSVRIKLQSNRRVQNPRQSNRRPP